MRVYRKILKMGLLFDGVPRYDESMNKTVFMIRNKSNHDQFSGGIGRYAKWGSDPCKFNVWRKSSYARRHLLEKRLAVEAYVDLFGHDEFALNGKHYLDNAEIVEYKLVEVKK